MTKAKSPLQNACKDFVADMVGQMYRLDISDKELAQRVGVGERRPGAWRKNPDVIANLPLERLYRIKTVLRMEGRYL